MRSTNLWYLLTYLLLYTQSDDKADDNMPAAPLPTHNDNATPSHDVSFVSSSTQNTMATVKARQTHVTHV